MNDMNPSPGPSPIEQRLASWRPATTSLDRDGMLFDAGRAAASRGRAGGWKLATLVATACTLALTWQLAQEQSRRHALEAALTARPAAPEPVAAAGPEVAPDPPAQPIALSPSSYLALSSRLTTGRLDPSEPAAPALPEPAATTPTLRPHSFESL